MTASANEDPHTILYGWLLSRSRSLDVANIVPKGPSSVTLVTYHFWPDDSQDARFNALEAAIRETWCRCGMLRTVIVVNRTSPCLEKFARSNSMVSIVACTTLVSGNLYSMSVDCISQLHTRFDTEYALIIQTDGFPIRSGLEEFLGPWDYIGAPWKFNKDDWITRRLLRHRSDVGNGGFSLRSRKLCEMAAWYYNRRYKHIPECYLITEDYFVCKTLPSFEKRYRQTIKIAPAEVAATFSLEDNRALHAVTNAQPFGFHGASAFKQLIYEGQVPSASTPSNDAES